MPETEYNCFLGPSSTYAYIIIHHQKLSWNPKIVAICSCFSFSRNLTWNRSFSGGVAFFLGMAFALLGIFQISSIQPQESRLCGDWLIVHRPLHLFEAEIHGKYPNQSRGETNLRIFEASSTKWGRHNLLQFCDIF